MAQQFSNTSTGDAPADPYKKATLDTEVTTAEKIEDLGRFVAACKFGMMTTKDSGSGNLVSRAMALAAQETGGVDLLFHTNTESGKTDDLAADSHINVAFITPSGEWASISGNAEILTDRSLVKKHYSPLLKAWLGDLGDGVHDGGEEDPRIGIIRVKTISATYAINRKNIISRAIDIAQGAATGKPASVNKLRQVTESEIKEWRAVH
ncbi:hypothetical protein GQ53DRAFT_214556 [Thozetella sp. PMI_491]|nr:hypothetical protein GQ53DRAFT_214556 [Thozetella sp. PMI_491]